MALNFEPMFDVLHADEICTEAIEPVLLLTRTHNTACVSHSWCEWPITWLPHLHSFCVLCGVCAEAVETVGCRVCNQKQQKNWQWSGKWDVRLVFCRNKERSDERGHRIACEYYGVTSSDWLPGVGALRYTLRRMKPSRIEHGCRDYQG
jgi:hypothetical protein